MSTYLDHNATTPLEPRVLEAMTPYLSGAFGNPSSGHQFGRVARAAVEAAREQVAALVKAHPSQVVFCSGGTEANNFAIKGVAARHEPGVLVLSAVEHASVQEPAQSLQQRGWRLFPLAVDGQGCISPEAVQEAMAQRPQLVAVMLANNETGAIHPVAAIAEAARAAGAVVLTDAVQAAGKIPVDFAASGAHLMSLSAHKLYGPKGMGALVVDKAVDMEPLLHGGGQEKGRRAGTENVAAIVGFGKAAELALAELQQHGEHMQRLRDHFEQRLAAEVPGAVVFAAEAERLPNTSFLAVPGIDGETLLLALDQAGMAVSSGSACGTDEEEPSHVLQAMGVAPELARGAIRVSLGRQTRREEVEQLLSCLKQQLQLLQRFGSVACA
jgi:cysteine desulfurase